MSAAWRPMSFGSGQVSGDVWRLHAYAWRKSHWTGLAHWVVCFHCETLAEGFADSLPAARKAAEAAMATNSQPSPDGTPDTAPNSRHDARHALPR